LYSLDVNILTSEMREEYLGKMERELRIRGYSPRTKKAYLECVNRYFDFKKKQSGSIG